MVHARYPHAESPASPGLPNGPWEVVPHPVSGDFRVVDQTGREVARVDFGVPHPGAPAQFVAHARLDLGRVLQDVMHCWDRVVRMEAEVETLLFRLARDMELQRAEEA